MNEVQGLLIIVHVGFFDIAEREALEILRQEYEAINSKFLFVREDISLEDAAFIHWESYFARQREWYESEFKPTIQANPDFKIVYFGMTHIPLAMHLGYLIGSAREVKVYQRDYQTKKWEWPDKANKVKNLNYKRIGFPTDQIGGYNDAVVRFGTYVRIATEDTKAVIDTATKEVDVHLDPIERDAFVNRSLIEQSADEFLEAIESLRNHMRLNAVHVFAAVPVGLAFLMGQKITANRHPRIYIYHYKQSRTPSYQFAGHLQGDHKPVLIPEEKDKKAIENLRHSIADDLRQSIKRFCRNIKTHEQSWVPLGIDEEGAVFFMDRAWEGLDSIDKTILAQTKVKMEGIDENSDEFYNEKEWSFPDQFLFHLLTRMDSAKAVRDAMRVFMFHETIHFKCHGLEPSIAVGIGRFPKILETIDYHADVYALINEYQFQLECDVDLKPQKVFLKTIDLMIETMWAFDAPSNSLGMQMRRINRYLMWYYQRELIAHDSCKTIVDVLRILSDKPEIEINGLKTATDPEGRFIAQLNGFKIEDLEIAVLFRNKVKPFGRSRRLPLEKLVESFSKKNGEEIKSVMSSLVALISPQT